jgi:ribosomal protein S18 acetylase RimI-like enzyme
MININNLILPTSKETTFIFDVGRIYVGYSNNNAFIYSFKIDEEYQGLGYGRAILKAIIEYLKSFKIGSDKSLDYVTLICDITNMKAINLYESIGFKTYKENYIDGSNEFYQYKLIL